MLLRMLLNIITLIKQQLSVSLSGVLIQFYFPAPNNQVYYECTEMFEKDRSY